MVNNAARMGEDEDQAEQAKGVWGIGRMCC